MALAIAFYLLAGVTLGAGFGVVSSRNPVHSVLFLILSFFSAAGLFVTLGAEFLAMLLVVVYVGAVAVLFLFVVMMLDVDFAALRQGFARYLPSAADRGLPGREMVLVAPWLPRARQGRPVVHGDVSNAEASGGCSTRIHLLPGGRPAPLAAMIGAIVLTLRHKPGVRGRSS